jgi:hypothetical protein
MGHLRPGSEVGYDTRRAWSGAQVWQGRDSAVVVVMMSKFLVGDGG